MVRSCWSASGTQCSVYQLFPGARYTGNVRWPRDVHRVQWKGGWKWLGVEEIGCNIPPHVFSTTETLVRQEQEIIKVHHTSSVNTHRF
jgi:hypothetical protein